MSRAFRGSSSAVRVFYVSDLHMEIRQFRWKKRSSGPYSLDRCEGFAALVDAVFPRRAEGCSTDVVCLLGDIGNPYCEHYRRLLEEASRRFDLVIVVPGNHESYGSSVEKSTGHLRSLARDIASSQESKGNVLCLHGESYDLPGTDLTFVGSTLWEHVDEVDARDAYVYLSDFREIREFRLHGVRGYNRLHDSCARRFRRLVSGPPPGGGASWRSPITLRDPRLRWMEYRPGSTATRTPAAARDRVASLRWRATSSATRTKRTRDSEPESTWCSSPARRDYVITCSSRHERAREKITRYATSESDCVSEMRSEQHRTTIKPLAECGEFSSQTDGGGSYSFGGRKHL
jgi:hypothetical protein